MKASDIREMPDQEIEVQIQKAREKLFKFRFHAANEDMQRAGEIRTLRRDVARLKTVQRQRVIAAKKQAAPGGQNGGDSNG